MSSVEISGHNQVYQHVLTNYQKTTDFIEANKDSEDQLEETKEKIMQDLSSTLVLILDNMGRQKAIQALEIYREHEKFRKQLESMNDDQFGAAAVTENPHIVPEETPDKEIIEEPIDDGFLQISPRVEEEKKVEKTSPRRVGRKISSHSVRSHRTTQPVEEIKPIDETDQPTEGAASTVVVQQNGPVGGWGVAQGMFKEAFEEIMEETVALSHYCTNSFRSYKQNATQTDHKLKELTSSFAELQKFKDKQIKQAEEQIRANKHNQDPSVLEGIKEWYNQMTTQLKEAKKKFQTDEALLLADQKREKATKLDLEDLVDDLVDDIIGAIRKEHTNFDNNWLPLYEYHLDANSQFVKYVGVNTILCQDQNCQIYFFSADELELRHKMSRKFKVYDAFGNDRFIVVALDKRNIQIFDRANYEVVKQIRTTEQVVVITYNSDRYFQCSGMNGFRIFYDVQRAFKATTGEVRQHDILSAKSSCKFGDQFGLQAEDEIFTDIAHDTWIKIDDQRESFYKFHFVNDQEQVTPIRLKGLDFNKIRSIVPSPYFGMDGNYHVAFMDDKGIVQLVEVELLEGEFNEGLTLSPFTPTLKLIDVYGAENMESLGQQQSNELQKELFLVGVRSGSAGKRPTIWLKHYKKGILTVDEHSDEGSNEDDEELDNTKLR